MLPKATESPLRTVKGLERGQVHFNFENASQEQVERFREIVMNLFESGGFDVRSGSVTMHFDHEGDLREIETNTKKKWRTR